LIRFEHTLVYDAGFSLLASIRRRHRQLLMGVSSLPERMAAGQCGLRFHASCRGKLSYPRALGSEIRLAATGPPYAGHGRPCLRPEHADAVAVTDIPALISGLEME